MKEKHLNIFHRKSNGRLRRAPDVNAGPARKNTSQPHQLLVDVARVTPRVTVVLPPGLGVAVPVAGAAHPAWIPKVMLGTGSPPGQKMHYLSQRYPATVSLAREEFQWRSQVVTVPWWRVRPVILAPIFCRAIYRPIAEELPLFPV